MGFEWVSIIEISISNKISRIHVGGFLKLGYPQIIHIETYGDYGIPNFKTPPKWGFHGI